MASSTATVRPPRRTVLERRGGVDETSGLNKRSDAVRVLSGTRIVVEVDSGSLATLIATKQATGATLSEIVASIIRTALREDAA